MVKNVSKFCLLISVLFDSYSHSYDDYGRPQSYYELYEGQSTTTERPDVGGGALRNGTIGDGKKVLLSSP